MIFAKGCSKFSYPLFDEQGGALGELTLPTWIAVPRNGWACAVVPRGVQDGVKIVVDGRSYRVEYELMSDRAAVPNDLNFLLMDEVQILASTVARVSEPGNWRIDLADRSYALSRCGGAFSSMRFELRLGSNVVGEIAETTGFSLWRRSFAIDLPREIGLAVQAFMFFLAVNSSFR